MADAVVAELLVALPGGVLLDLDIAATYPDAAAPYLDAAAPYSDAAAPYLGTAVLYLGTAATHLHGEAEWAEFGRPPGRADLIGIREPGAVWGAVLRSHPMITVLRGRSQLSIKAATGGCP